MKNYITNKNNRNYFESLIRTCIDRFFIGRQIVYSLIDNTYEIVWSSIDSDACKGSFLSDIKYLLPDLGQPKIFADNGHSKFIIPVNIGNEMSYYIIIENSSIYYDNASNSFKAGASSMEFLKSINFLSYILEQMFRSIIHEFRTREYFRNISSTLEFDDIFHESDLLHDKISSVLNSIASMTGKSLAVLHIYDPDLNRLGIMSTAGDPSFNNLDIDIANDSNYITNSVWENKEKIRVKIDERNSNRFDLISKTLNKNFYAYMGVPVKDKNEFVGLLELFRTEPSLYTLEDECAAQLTGSYISVIYKTYVYIGQEKHLREQLQKTNKEMKKTEKDLQAGIKRINAIYSINKVIRSVIKPDEMIKKLIGVIRDATESDEVFIFLKDENSYELVLQGCPDDYISSIGFIRIPFGKGIEGIAAQTQMPVAVTENVINDPRYESILDLELKYFNSVYAVPILIKEKKVIGVLELRNNNKREYSQSEKKLITAITDQLAIAIENALLHKKTELLSLTDDMTGLNNFRYFQQKLKDEITRSKRYERDISLLMLDIDHFKKVNDTYGHLKGDIILKMVAHVITQTVRDVDMPARYGGEEFVVILPETNQKDSITIADRIRKRVEEIDFSGQEGLEYLKITISIGVASFPVNATKEKALIEAADKACYEAKRTGRNRVIGFSSISSG